MASSIVKNSPASNAGEFSKIQPAAKNVPRRPPRAMQFLLLVLILVLVALMTLPGAWSETSRREAYLPQLEAEARQRPFDGRLLALLGGRLMQSGENTAAAETLRRALAAGEQHPQVWLNFAAATAASGDIARALADLNLGVRAHPNDPDLHRAQERANNLAPGFSPIQLAQNISPGGPGLLINLYSKGSFLNSPIEWWGRLHPDTSGFITRERWTHEAPNDVQVQWRWGLALLRNRRTTEATSALQRTVTLDPNFAPAHLALAGALDSQGLFGEAAMEYLQTLKLQPACVPAQLGAGKAYLENGLAPIAIACYSRATVLDPKSTEAWIGLGQAYRTTGVDHDKSVVAFEKAVRLAPTRTDYYDDYADALRQAVQWPAAEKVLGQRLKEAPGDPLAHYMLGMVLLNNNPTPERQITAEAETREALRLFPHNPLADIQLAQIMLSKQRQREAIELLQDALQSDPHNRNAMTVLARAYRQSGRNDLSERFSKQADSLYRDQERAQVLESQEAKHLMQADFHENLGRLYIRVGEQKKAMYEQNMARLLRENPLKAAEELRKLSATRNAALPAP